MAEIKVTFDAADQYERFMGRWSRAVGERFLEWLAPSVGLRWLDVGCGTGAFSETVLKRSSPASISGIDPAPAQIEQARKQTPNAEFRVADATALPFGEGAFDIVASALVINFIPNRAKAFSEMHRVLRSGGTIAAYLWDRSPTTEFSPHAPMERGMHQLGVEPMRPPIAPESTPDGARAALEKAGFCDAEITTLEVEQAYRDFDDYWETQTLSFHPIGKSIAALNDAQRAKLHDTMRAMLPPRSDGSIVFSARALAFKAQKLD